ADEYGLDVIRAAVETLLANTKRRVQAEIAGWKDGEAEGFFFLDHDGTGDNKRVRIHVKATKRGDKLTLDFSGTDPQGKGPINVPLPTSEAVSCIAVLAATDPTISMNTGVREAVDFVIPEGTVTNPRWPATVNHYFPTAHMIYSAVLSALGKLNP